MKYYFFNKKLNCHGPNIHKEWNNNFKMQALEEVPGSAMV